MYGKESQTEAGAWVVLNFWPNFRLAVLIAVVLIEKRVLRESLYFREFAFVESIMIN